MKNGAVDVDWSFGENGGMSMDAKQAIEILRKRNYSMICSPDMCGTVNQQIADIIESLAAKLDRLEKLERVAKTAKYRQDIKHKKLDECHEIDVLMREMAENALNDALAALDAP